MVVAKAPKFLAAPNHADTLKTGCRANGPAKAWKDKPLSVPKIKKANRKEFAEQHMLNLMP